MKKNKLMKPAALLVAVACVFGFSACSKNQSSSSAKTASTESSKADQTTIYGKVTAIDGSNVTLALGTRNKRSEPSGDRKSATPPSGDSKSQTPPSGNPDGNGGPSALTLTGKTKTITISDTSILKKESVPTAGNWKKQSSEASGKDSNGPTMTTTTAAISDVTVGTILKVTYQNSDEKLVSVIITSRMGGGHRGQTPDDGAKATDSKATK